MNYENITDLKATFADGSENPSGIAEEALIVPVSWFETIQTPDPEGVTAKGIVHITGSHVLKEGKSPINVNVLYDKSGASSAVEGEILSKIFKTSIELFIPQVTAENVGTVTALKNYRCLLFIRKPDQDSGWIQVGSKSLAIYVENVEANLGVGPTGEPGIRMTVGGYNKSPYYYYDGEIVANP